MKKALLLLGMVVAGAVSSLGAAELDETEWKMRLRNPTGAVMFWKTDTLNFKDGQFFSSNRLDDGFRPASYEETKSGAVVRWSAVQTNEQGETARWEGVKRGTRMEGTYTLTRSQGDSKQYKWRAKIRDVAPEKG